MYEILENNYYYSLFLIIKDIIATDETKNYVINIKYNYNRLINRISHFV